MTEPITTVKNTEYECPICKDEGVISWEDEQGYFYSKPCSCTKVKAAKARLKKSGLSPDSQEKSFDSFLTNGNPVLTDAKKTVMKYAEDFQKLKDSRHNSLLLCGQSGAGKTHLGAACSIRIMEQGTPVIYMGYREEMIALKSQILDHETYSRQIDRFKKAEVLFIDDFLKGKITEADLNALYEIINYRYNHHLPVIISTEKNLDNLLKFDEAVGSRLIEMGRGHIIELEGKELNYRLFGNPADNNPA